MRKCEKSCFALSQRIKIDFPRWKDLIRRITVRYCEWLTSRRGMLAVSYTHLDVYKRQVKRETPVSPVYKQPTRSGRRDRRSIAELSLPITERITTPDPVVPSEPTRKKPATTSDGRPVRPQRGSYVGSDRDSIPMSERERPSRPSDRSMRDVKRSAATPASPDREQAPRRSKTCLLYTSRCV